MGIGKRKADPDSFDSEDIDIGILSLKPLLTKCSKEGSVIHMKKSEEDFVHGKKSGEDFVHSKKSEEADFIHGKKSEEDCVNSKKSEEDFIQSKKSEEDCVNGGCETPKGQENKIPECLECPPAPRKARPRVKRKPEKIARDFFFVPADLDSVFFPYQILRPRKKFQWSGSEKKNGDGLI